jgi:membrane protein DedA with SNARE-associated domain
MHSLATAGQSSAPGAWAYLVVFIAAAAGYMGVPVIGTAVIAGAAVLASQSELNIAAVLIVAAIGCEIGGLGGFRIGFRWGRQLLERPGPALDFRKKTVAKGEEVYQKWGRAAVFVTPSIVSGALDMKFGQFVVWNFLAGTVFAVSVGAGAYGAGKVSTGHADSVSLGMLVGGVAVAALCTAVAVRYYRRHRARASAVQLPAPGGGSAARPSPAQLPATGDGSAALPPPEADSTVHQNP